MKKIKKKRSIALELTISLLLTTAVFAFITIGAAFGLIRWSDARHHEHKISEYFQFLSTNLSLPVWNYDSDGIRKIGDTFAQNENVSMVEITNENSEILFRYASPTHLVQMERKKGIEYSGMTIGYVKVGFIPNLGKTYDRELLLSLLILVITLFVLAFITGFFLRKMLKVPLDNLIQGMDQIAKGAYSFSDHLYDYVEFRKILVQFDQMARSIRQREGELADMNQQLSASEIRFRTMAESVPCAIFRCAMDDTWTMQFIGPQIQIISGYPATDFIDCAVRSYADIMHPDDIETVDRLVDQAIDEKRKWIVEYRIIHADGSVRWVYEEGVAVFNSQDEVAYLDGFILDRTEKKFQEEELRSLRNYLANIIDSMPSALIVVDKEGNVTRWNSEAERLTGIARNTAAGQHLTEVIPRLVDEMDRVQQAMVTGEVQSDPRRTYREAGQVRYEDVTVYPLKGVSGIEGAVIRLDDVTEQVRIEEMMVQSEKMLSVGGLAAGMAHEINNPLAGVMQTANVMCNRLADTELPANRLAAEEAGTSMEAIEAFMEARGIIRMLKNIRESGNRAAEIVSNMLSFARKSDSRMSTYNIAELLDRTMDLAGIDFDLKKKHDFRQIEIVREYEDNLPHVPCDAGKIQQVFLNILRNGAEAMQEKMEKDIRKNPRFILRLAYEKSEDMIVVEIADNGPGMDEATCKRVFEPFFTRKSVGNGTGLGLSISYFIVTENHGGRMSVESTPGEGSRFTVKLPVKRKTG